MHAVCGPLPRGCGLRVSFGLLIFPEILMAKAARADAEGRGAMTDPTKQLLRGTLHVLILKTLTEGPMHGYAVASRIARQTAGVVEIEDGALYQALHRMQERGWVESEWGHAESGKRARFYRLTTSGRRRLAVESAGWQRYADAVLSVLHPRGG